MVKEVALKLSEILNTLRNLNWLELTLGMISYKGSNLVVDLEEREVI